MVNKVLAFATTGVLAAALMLALPACTSTQKSASSSTSSTASNAPVIKDWPIIHDTDFGGIYLDMTIDEFNKHGFKLGDSVDVVFSNGYKLLGIPYYNGYYTRTGDPLVVGYPGYPYIKVAINNGDPLWDVSGVSDSDTATVTVAQAGAYAATQDAFNITYTNERSDYASDEVFANFRELSGGNLRSGVAYRSASPIDNTYNRAPYVEKLMKQVSVAYVLDLSDSNEEADTLIAKDKETGVDVSCFTDLRDAGCVGMLDLPSSYPTETYAKKLAAGLVEMTKHEGPYLIHCVEGKDRTGFVCILLESLAGASYDEMQADYMATYANYYGITKESDPERYSIISNLYFDGMMLFLAGVDDGTDLRFIDFSGPARNYLLNGGMSSEQVDALVARIRA